MKVIDLLNKIANGEEVPEKIKLHDTEYHKCILKTGIDYKIYSDDFYYLSNAICKAGFSLNDEVEIIEEEKKIPEKHINNYGDLIILGQQDNWLEPTIETDQKINAQLNPYVFEAINENFKDIENKIYEIIDYIQEKQNETTI